MKPAPTGDRERWSRVEALFHEASGLDPGVRDAWFEERAASGRDDPSVLATVRALLDHASPDDGDGRDETFDGPLRPDWAVALRALAGLAPQRLSTPVGDLRVGDPVGFGGMGVVFSARFVDGPEGEFAVKMSRLPGPGTPGADDSAERQLEREIRSLERLDHPAIARLVTSGRAPDGRTFHVTECIDGLPITAACDRARADVETRIRIFCAVCDAVQHAHARLLVHRDLKPANVLVDADGAPHVIDFGIAKLLGPENRAHAGTPTLGAVTLEYASPEQILDQPVTTASDVYGLGVLLFELLVGRTPHGLRSLRELVRRMEGRDAPSLVAVLESEPAERREAIAGLRRTTPGRLARRLRGDLESIVAGALRLEPGERYETVARLAEDLRSHLDGGAVRVRRPSTWARFARFARRHRAALAAAAFPLAAAVYFAAASVLDARAAREQERVTRDVLAAFVDVFDADEREVDPHLEAREFLDQTVERLATSSGLDPVIRASVLKAIGRMYVQLDVPERASDAWRRALRIVREELPRGADRRREILYLMCNLGIGEVARGRLEEARSILDGVVRDAEAVADDALAADAWAALADADLRGRAPSEAAVKIRRALDLRIRHYGRGSEQARRTALETAGILRMAGDLEAARALYLVHRDAEEPEFRLRAMRGLGLLELAPGGDPARAAGFLRSAVAAADADDDVGPLASGRLCAMVAFAESRAGRHVEAEPWLRRALEAHVAWSPGHWQTDDMRSRLGGCLLEQGRYAEAEPLLVPVAERLEAALGEDHVHAVEARARADELTARK